LCVKGGFSEIDKINTRGDSKPTALKRNAFPIFPENAIQRGRLQQRDQF